MTIKILGGPLIRASQALSDPLNCTDGQIVRIHMPDSWLGVDTLTFQISVDGQIWHDLFDAHGGEVMVKVVPGTVALVQHHQVREAWIRFRSGWRANPQPQDADRVFMTILDLVHPGGPKAG